MALAAICHAERKQASEMGGVGADERVIYNMNAEIKVERKTWKRLRAD